MSLLTPEDLAYMRETQAETRPTEAILFPATSQSDGMGGRTSTVSNADADGQPIQVRVNDGNDATQSDDIPQDLAGRYGTTNLYKFVTDLVMIQPGDRIRVVATSRLYEVVSDQETQEWSTAQVVWCVRAKGTP